MKKKLLLLFISGAICVQSCKKTEPVSEKAPGPVSSIDQSSGLRLNAVGDYNNYQVLSAESNLSPEISNFSLKNGGTGALATFNNQAHQKWRITNVGNGYYTIMNLGSGKMLQAYKHNGADVLIQNSADGSDNQLWAIRSIGNKRYKAVSKSTGLAITNGGNMLKLAVYASLPSQTWGYNILPAVGYRDDVVVNFFHRKLRSQGSVAFDQGSSIPLTYGANNGKVLWIAEDSFDGIRLKSDNNSNLMCGFFQYNNSVLIQPSLTDWNPDNTPNITIANSLQGRPRQVFDNQPGTDWSWPGVGVEIGDKVYVYSGEGKGLGITNQSIWEMKQSTTSLEWEVKRTTPEGMSGQTDIGYATGMVKPGDGYVYAYGTKGVFFNAANVYVARFPETNPQDWTFWNGKEWSKTRTSDNSAAIASGQQNLTISYYKGKYIMMQLDLGFFCDPKKHNIYLSTATSPLGPFTKPVEVFTIEDRYRGHLNRYYTPMIHPQFDNGKNELLLTYSVNFNECTTQDNCENNEMDATQYQVKGVRVPYSMIGM